MAEADVKIAIPELEPAKFALDPERDAIGRARQGGLEIVARQADDELWLALCRDETVGGLALRFPLFSTQARCRAVKRGGALLAIEWTSKIGEGRLDVTGEVSGLEQLRATLTFTPRDDLKISFVPRDVVPFGKDGDVDRARGVVEASQRKMNTGLLYFGLSEPEFGKVLYLQNWTALNDYFNATGSKPDGAVGGQWPDIGYRPPVNPATGAAVLPKGRRITLYDTILVIRQYPQVEEGDSAWQFLDMLGAIYPWLSPPRVEFRDWHERSLRTIEDLAHRPDTRVRHYGHTYFHPYVAAEYPDSMVQLSIGSALNEWGRWTGRPHPLEREIVAGLEKFYDPKLKTLRRYLPNVGDDKNADAVDSWYLYHPLLNLANLALAGNEEARELFLKSIDYGIRAARHFKYKWPIMYDVTDFKVITDVAETDNRGQTDVGGIYAWVMLQAFEMTHDQRFLDEAKAAIDATCGMRFDLNYQANLTAWGAAACIRLWRITNHKHHLTQSYVYLASFFHNSQLWESEIGRARHTRNFMGVTCLQDAPYMAAYECFDSFAAFERYLDFGGPDLIPSVKLLIGEYCAHALHRAWCYYPDALPKDLIASENRNGHIDRELSFPVEDLYPDDQKAGQVGQEIYGAGAAMVYATRAFRQIEGAPFRFYCDHFLRAVHRLEQGAVSMALDGPEITEALIVIVPTEQTPKGFAPVLWRWDQTRIEFRKTNGRFEARVPASAILLLRW